MANPPEERIMSVESNKAIVRRIYEEIVGSRRLDLADELVSPDYVDHNAALHGWPQGPEGFRVHAAYIHQVFDQLTIAIEEIIAEGERVVVTWRLKGRHVGETWGVPATGRLVESVTTSLVRLRDGKVVEYEARPDRLGLLSQFGQLGDYAVHFRSEAG